MKLLGTSYKIEKSDKWSKDILSKIMYLAPSTLSGKNVCTWASKGCIAACLNTAGRGAMSNVQQARVNRTNLFFNDRNGFETKLRKEMTSFVKKCDKAVKTAAMRLNGTSDLAWETIFPDLFTDYKTSMFYDYTKSVRRAIAFARGEMPSNYHITFSRSEVNDQQCLDVLKEGGNVAVVFKDELPKTWKGFPVFNADEHDLRFLDKKGVAGLTAKGRAKKDTSGFVVGA
tara:strand:- start:38 stop:724 length:687 start_codon:yes stop_codon:yes gene_type:complete